MCIDIVESCLGIAHGQISSIFDRIICPRHDNGGVLSFHVLFNISYHINLKFCLVGAIYTLRTIMFYPNFTCYEFLCIGINFLEFISSVIIKVYVISKTYLYNFDPLNPTFI